MEKTRVPKGEKYYLINTTCGALDVDYLRDWGTSEDDAYYENGNYFATQEEAESMAKKLRAVLRGADVIETPSDKEIEEAMETSVTESILCVAPYESFTPRATDLLECAWMKGAEWLKSKIVK